jgi:hypothetical protein
MSSKVYGTGEVTIRCTTPIRTVGALEQLKLADFLVNTGFSEEETQFALTQIIARAVYPASEPEGFIKYSGIFEGNMQDCSRLEEIITNLRSQTLTSKRAVVVIDAGIATEENPAMLTAHNFDYVCVSRCKLKDYTIDPACLPVEVEDKKKITETDIDTASIHFQRRPSTVA